MSATLLTLALLGPGVADDRCHFDKPILPVHRSYGFTFIKPPLVLTAKPKPKKRKVSKPKVDDDCGTGVIADDGPALLPAVVAAPEDVPVIAEVPAIDAFTQPAAGLPSEAVPADASPTASYEGPIPMAPPWPATVLGGGIETVCTCCEAPVVVPVPEPKTWMLIAMGLGALIFRRSRNLKASRWIGGAMKTKERA